MFPKAELTDLPPRDIVHLADAEKALALARTRLEHERAHGTPSGEVDELTEWFLDTMADPEAPGACSARRLLEK